MFSIVYIDAEIGTAHYLSDWSCSSLDPKQHASPPIKQQKQHASPQHTLRVGTNAVGGALGVWWVMASSIDRQRKNTRQSFCVLSLIPSCSHRLNLEQNRTGRQIRIEQLLSSISSIQKDYYEDHHIGTFITPVKRRIFSWRISCTIVIPSWIGSYGKRDLLNMGWTAYTNVWHNTMRVLYIFFLRC